MTTIDSPSATMITSPCRSTKCSATMTKPSVDVNQGVNQSSSAAASPEQPLGRAAERSADEDERGRREVERHQPQNRANLGERGAADVHASVQDDDGEVADPEGEALAIEGVGNRERDEEKRSHAAEQEKLMAEMVGGDRIRQPRVAVVHPPDHREHDDDLRERGSVSAAPRGRWSAA